MKHNQLRATAYHEAGHAVAALHHNIKLRELSIVPSQAHNSLGHILQKSRAIFTLNLTVASGSATARSAS
jgi:ATP-dependent Zn protease